LPNQCYAVCGLNIQSARLEVIVSLDLESTDGLLFLLCRTVFLSLLVGLFNVLKVATNPLRICIFDNLRPICAQSYVVVNIWLCG
ncbi:hypothetical protein BDR22DRAFT_952385, partial [Usnea florida]